MSVFVVNNAHSGRTISLDVDGQRAIDATFPAASRGVSAPAVSGYRYHLKPGKHRLVAADSDQRAQLVVPIKDANRVWVVIQDYDAGVPLEAKLYDRRPGFG